MPEIKRPTVTDLKNAIYELISGLDTVKKRIFEQRLKNIDKDYRKTT